MEQDNPKNPMPQLHHRQPGEVIYDDSFEIEGHNFYMILPPSEELFREAIEMFDKTEELVEGYFTMNPTQFSTAFSFMMAQSDYMHRTGEQVEKVFDILIGSLIVAWDIPEEDDGVWPCTDANKKDLTMVSKRLIVERLIERIRLWLMII